MAKLLAPNIRIDWYPDGHFADIENITKEELNSGYNLSQHIASGYTLGYVDPDTVETTTVFDDYTSQRIRANRYEAEISFFLYTNGHSVAESLFYGMETPSGYLAHRWGYPCDKDYSDPDTLYTLDLFKFQADIPKISSSSDIIQMNVRFIPQGSAFRIDMLNKKTYNDLQDLWTNMTYTQVQDIMSGKTYYNLIEEIGRG